MKRLKYILQGFSNFIRSKLGISNLSEDNKVLFSERLSICNNCTNYSNYLGMCKICGCICRAKVAVEYDLDGDGKSIEGCPIRKW